MSDRLIRGTAADGQIRFFAADSRDLVEYARTAHELSPIATAALGRLLTAGSMMGAMMKNDDDVLTVKIDCDGPIKGLTVTADSRGFVRGFVRNPDVDLPSKVPGKLNVGDALDLGVLSVIRDVGLKEPYVGQTILVSGEIAEDLTYYFATSEQTPSSVALGVLVDRDGTVLRAGGFIVQLMPGASEETLAALEEALSDVRPVTETLDKGVSIEDLILSLLHGLSPEISETREIGFRCTCSRAHTEEILAALSKDELRSMIDDGEPVEVRCQFCGKKYVFTPEELRKLL